MPQGRLPTVEPLNVERAEPLVDDLLKGVRHLCLLYRIVAHHQIDGLQFTGRDLLSGRTRRDAAHVEILAGCGKAAVGRRKQQRQPLERFEDRTDDGKGEIAGQSFDGIRLLSEEGVGI